jgi:hypothetical protein
MAKCNRFKNRSFRRLLSLLLSFVSLLSGGCCWSFKKLEEELINKFGGGWHGWHSKIVYMVKFMGALFPPQPDIHS